MESSSNILSNSAASSVAQAPTMRPKEEQEVTSANAKEEVKEKKVPEEKTPKRSPIELLEEAHNEKFKRYEAECTQYLMSKYFSDKTIFGGKVLRSNWQIISWDRYTFRKVLPTQNGVVLVSVKSAQPLSSTPACQSSPPSIFLVSSSLFFLLFDSLLLLHKNIKNKTTIFLFFIFNLNYE